MSKETEISAAVWVYVAQKGLNFAFPTSDIWGEQWKDG